MIFYKHPSQLMQIKFTSLTASGINVRWHHYFLPTWNGFTSLKAQGAFEILENFIKEMRGYLGSITMLNKGKLSHLGILSLTSLKKALDKKREVQTIWIGQFTNFGLQVSGMWCHQEVMARNPSSYWALYYSKCGTLEESYHDKQRKVCLILFMHQIQ